MHQPVDKPLPLRRRLAPWCLALAALLPAALQAQPRFALDSTPTVLPKTVLPLHVRLWLDLDPARDTFAGAVTIAVRARQAVPSITLHAQGLQSESALLLDGTTRRVLSVAPDEAAGTWRLTPADGRPIAAGRHELQLRYRGHVERSGEGLYRADYRVQGRDERMLATQLEAVQARRLLPVFDEPVFRTRFELSVRAPLGWQVLGNMPLLGTRAEGGAVLHRFATTPAMPAYLLALAVGHFDVLEGRSGGTPLRIYTPQGKREQARLAMQATQQVLPYYASYFGRPFALPKLDQLAVPGTRGGAMEDWGLISYVEDSFLHDPVRSGVGTPRRVFGIVAHEVAHQWFGNLVSVASWSEIWLNEAFATWMEKKAAEHFHPEWQTALHTRHNLAHTMARDATPATRAIRSGPVSEDSVFEVFDGITYGKGGAVLSMLEQWIGAAPMQRGLAAYMAERAFQPATAGDLWHHIGRATGQPVAAVAASWTDQPGLPLVSVATTCEDGRTLLTLRQERHALGEPMPGGPWQVPVRVDHGGQELTLLLTEASQRFELPGCPAEPLRANAGGRGYYVVGYEPALRRRLAQALPTLPAADQATLLADSFALAGSGRQPMADHLALLAALPRVQGPGRAALMDLALSQWETLDLALHGTPAQEPLRAAGRALFGPELGRLGWQPLPGEDHESQVLRGRLIRRLADLQDAGVVAQARTRWAAALDPRGGALPTSLRGAVLAAVGADATPAEFATLLEALKASDSQEERWMLLRALAAGRDAAQAQVLLGLALSEQLPPDIGRAIPGHLAERPEHVDAAYAFVLANWDALQRRAGVGPFGGRNWLLPSAADAAHDAATAERLLADQRRLAGAAGDSMARSTAQEILQRQRLREREAAPLAAALAGWAPLSAPR